MNKTFRVALIAAVDVAAAVTANLVADSLGEPGLGKILMQAILAFGLTLMLMFLKGETGSGQGGGSGSPDPPKSPERAPVSASPPSAPSRTLTSRSTPAPAPAQVVSIATNDSRLRWTVAVAVWIIGGILVGSFLYPMFKDDARLLAVLPVGDSLVTDLAFASDETLCTVTTSVQKWNVQTHQQTFAWPGDWITGNLSPGCSFAGMSTSDRRVFVFSTTAMNTVARLPEQDSHVYSVAFDRAAKRIATGGPVAKIWTRNGKLIGEARDDGDASEVALSADGRLLATGSESDTLTIRSVPDLRVKHKIESVPSHATWALSFSNDAKTLAVAGKGGVVLLYDVATGKRLRVLDTKDDSLWLYQVAFSPDGRFVAAGDSEADVRIWRVDNGEPAGDPLKGHKHTVRALAFSPDGKVLASGGEEGEVRLWNWSKS